MILSINDDKIIQNANSEDLESAINQLGVDEFLILTKGDDTFLQCYLSNDKDTSVIEYRDGSELEHYSTALISKELTKAIFKTYLTNSEKIKKMAEWSWLDCIEPQRIINYDGDEEEQFLLFKYLQEGENTKKYPFGKFGTLHLIYDETDQALITKLDNNWKNLETKIVDELENQIKSYDRLGHLKVRYFQAMGTSTEYNKDVFHGTDSDIRLSFHLLESPTWEFFIKDDQIIHSQAAF